MAKAAFWSHNLRAHGEPEQTEQRLVIENFAAFGSRNQREWNSESIKQGTPVPQTSGKREMELGGGEARGLRSEDEEEWAAVEEVELIGGGGCD